jgi:hypothetical protein
MMVDVVQVRGIVVQDHANGNLTALDSAPEL